MASVAAKQPPVHAKPLSCNRNRRLLAVAVGVVGVVVVTVVAPLHPSASARTPTRSKLR